MSKSLRLGVTIFIMSSGLSFACDYNAAKHDQKWAFPSREIGIRLGDAVSAGEIEGKMIKSVFTTYKGKGLLIEAADGNGWWLFKRITRFFQGSKLFALHGIAYFPQVKNGKVASVAGCNMNFMFYDEDGDGRFERIVPYAFKIDHLPSWVSKQKGP